jgi:hypothetical protein
LQRRKCTLSSFPLHCQKLLPCAYEQSTQWSNLQESAINLWIQYYMEYFSSFNPQMPLKTVMGNRHASSKDMCSFKGKVSIKLPPYRACQSTCLCGLLGRPYQKLLNPSFFWKIWYSSNIRPAFPSGNKLQCWVVPTLNELIRFF